MAKVSQITHKDPVMRVALSAISGNRYECRKALPRGGFFVEKLAAWEKIISIKAKMNLAAVVTLLQLALSLLANSQGTTYQSQATAFANQAISVAQNALVAHATTTVAVNSISNTSTAAMVVGSVQVSGINPQGQCWNGRVGAKDIQVGSYTLTASPDEAIKITGITFAVQDQAGWDVGTSTLANLKITGWGNQLGSVPNEVYTNTPYDSSSSPFTILPGTTATVNFYADVLATSITRIYIEGISGTGITSGKTINVLDSSFHLLTIPTIGSSTPPYTCFAAAI